MHQQIFVNLPVKDLDRSVNFFTQLGFTFNPQFTDANATMMNVGENIHVMLMTEQFFSGFTNKGICDTSKVNESLITLGCASKAQVDDLVAKARANGGQVLREAEDHGFMYSHDFLDLDGHGWGLAHMTGATPS
jgi:predicted lactoylglutathione lyase